MGNAAIQAESKTVTPKVKRVRRITHPVIDDLVKTGTFTTDKEFLAELDKLNYRGIITRQGLLLYLTDMGLADSFQNKKVEAIEHAKEELAKAESMLPENQLKSVGQSLADVTTGLLYQGLRDGPWAYQKTLEFITKHPRSEIDLRNMIKLYEIYKSAKDYGKYLSLAKMAEMSGIKSAPIVRVMILDVGEKPFRQLKPHKRMTQEERERTRDVRRMGVSLEDIAYFTGFTGAAIGTTCSGIKIKDYFSVYNHKHNTGDRGNCVTLKTASKVYYAMDFGGLPPKEIIEYAEAKPKTVDIAKAERTRLEPIITKTLDMLYPGETHAVPYRDTYQLPGLKH